MDKMSGFVLRSAKKAGIPIGFLIVTVREVKENL